MIQTVTVDEFLEILDSLTTAHRLRHIAEWDMLNERGKRKFRRSARRLEDHAGSIGRVAEVVPAMPPRLTSGVTP